jgi:dipeptidyl aminopeptidase/acylaminoacyl peptidase
MKRLPITGLFALFVCIFCVPSLAAQDSLEGDWAGGSNLFQNPVFIHVRFVPTKSGIGGITNVQSWRVSNRLLTSTRLESSQVHFEFPSSTGELFVADGQLKDGVIQGTIRRGEQQGKFHLIRLARLDRKLYDKYVGAYQFPDPKQPGKFQLHLVTYGSLGHLRWVNLDTGETTGLFPSSEDKFFFAFSVVGSPFPDMATWSFETNKDGEVTRSVVRVKGQPDQVGSRTNLYKQEQVSILSNNIMLAATLVMPAAKGKHPAVVFAPGSAALSRDESSPFREFHPLISNGIALLIYDKRGTGGSSGDWQQASFDDLAKDVLAGVTYLKNRKEINRQKIGVWGFSQGGWIAPLAASRSKDIAFVIMASGGGVTNEQAEINDQVARMVRQKLSDKDIKEAVAFMQLQFEAAYSPEGWQRFEAAIPTAQGKPWINRTWTRIPKDDWWWQWWRMNGRYDPAPVLQKIKVPVLILFGAADQLVPPGAIAEIAGRAETSLKKGGNKDVTVKIFPNADHDLSVKLDTGQWVAPPDYHSTLTSWILKTVSAQK